MQTLPLHSLSPQQSAVLPQVSPSRRHISSGGGEQVFASGSQISERHSPEVEQPTPVARHGSGAQ